MKYDLHIHSVYSPCSINRPKAIIGIAKKIGLDGIAVTDHGTIKGAVEVKKLNKDKGFELITGEEIETDYGELLALYIQEEIRKKELFEVIDEIKSQDGIIAVAHPCRIMPWLRFRYPLDGLVGKIDAVEVFNSRNIFFGNQRAEKAVKNLDFAKIGSSDAHLPIDIGKGFTEFDGSLREAIKKRKTRAGGSTRYGLISAVLAAINKRVLSPLKVKKTWI